MIVNGKSKLHYNLNSSFRAAAMSMLFAPITVLLIVAHLNPVNGQPQHKKYAEDDKKDYSWTETGCYEDCDEFLKFRKGPKPKPMSEICSNLQYGCVPYNKLNSSGCGYEKRKLLGGNWVTTYIDPKAPNGYREAYMRLHGYRSGAKNSIGKFLGMNVPVMKEIGMTTRAELLLQVPDSYDEFLRSRRLPKQSPGLIRPGRDSRGVGGYGDLRSSVRRKQTRSGIPPAV